MAEATVYPSAMNPTTWHPFRMPSAAYWRRTPLRPAIRLAFRATSGHDLRQREAVLTARLYSTTGHSADPEQLQQLLDRIQGCPGRKTPPVAMQGGHPLHRNKPEQMALYGVLNTLLPILIK